MKRQWALTTLSQEDLAQPNFVVTTRTESRGEMPQSKSSQELVRTQVVPGREDNLSAPNVDIAQDSSKSVTTLHTKKEGKRSPKEDATSPTRKGDVSPLSSPDTLKIAKRSISSLPSKYLSEFFPSLKLEPMPPLNRNHQYTIKMEYVPPISRQMSRRTQRRLNSLPKNHIINFKRKKILAKSSQKAKINRMMKNELKPLQYQMHIQYQKRQQVFLKLIKVIASANLMMFKISGKKANDTLSLQRQLAASKIQNNYRKHKNWVLGKMLRRFNRNHFYFVLRIRTRMRTRLRTKKAKIVRWFVSKFTHFTKVNVAVKMYRFRVVQTQKFVRQWLQIKDARLVALLRKFSRLEYKYRYRLRSITQEVYTKMKEFQANDMSLLSIARKNLGDAKKKVGNAKLGKKKIKRNSVLMKALKEDVAPTLQIVRQTLGNTSLIHDAAAMTAAVAMNPASLSRDGNPIKKTDDKPKSNMEQTKNNVGGSSGVSSVLKRMSRDNLIEFSGNSAGLRFGSAVPLQIRVKALEKQLRRARWYYVREGSAQEIQAFVSGRFDAADVKRVLEYDLSVGQLLVSKRQNQGLFKPYTMKKFFSKKQFYKLIEKCLEDSAKIRFYSTDQSL